MSFFEEATSVNMLVHSLVSMETLIVVSITINVVWFVFSCRVTYWRVSNVLVC